MDIGLTPGGFMLVGAFFALSLQVLAGQTPAPAPDAFAPLRFLIGDWQGENGKGAPGQASKGEFSLREELGGKVLVRRNSAEYPAQEGRPAFRHDDLMTVFAEGGQLKALYADNEGHVIRYLVAKTAEGEGAVFLSEGPGPRFRMTCLRKSEDLIAIKFEIAPPGKDFSTYIEAAARRKR
jgi:hypothetical protein